MQIDRLSASAANTYEGCQMQYYMDYILKWRFPAGKAANIGTVTHKILEILGGIKLSQSKEESFENETFGIKIKSDEKISPDDVIDTVYNHYKAGKYKSDQFTNSDYNNCKRWINIVLNHGEGKFSPLKREVIALEQYFKIPIKEDWAILDDGSYFCMSGIIDTIYGVDENYLEMVDWKTGARKNWNTGEVYTYEKLHDNLQLRMYHYALNELYGYDKNYLITIFYLKDGGPFTLHFSPEDIEHTKETLRSMFTYIRLNKNPAQNRSWKCTKFCPYGKNTFGHWMFKDVALPVFEQNSHGGIADIGEKCTICDQIKYEMSMYDLDDITEKYKKPSKKNDSK